jgi:perosamine synthetase
MRVASTKRTFAHKPFVCERTDTILAVIEKCLNNGSGSCLVVNKDQTLAGRISLDDLRRSLLSGQASYDPSIENYITTDSFFAKVQLRRTFGPHAVLEPVLDSLGRLTDVRVDRSSQIVQVGKPALYHTEFRAVMDAFLSSWISSKGPYVKKFEDDFSAFVGMKHGVAVSNGTVALHLALATLGIGSGDEVIVPDLTFAATINAVLYCGATPVIVDVDPKTWGLSLETVAASCTTRTKAIIPVHLYGRPVEMPPIVKFAHSRGIAIIEDCAEAPGASYNGKSVGRFSDISCFSFYANKVVTTGEGGMCLTNSDRLAKLLRKLRDHGMAPDRCYWHDQIGYNYRLTNLQAAIGQAQLQKIDQTLRRNSQIEAKYKMAFQDIPAVQFPPVLPEDFGKVVWLSCVQVPAESRDAIIATGKRAHIELRPFFYPLSNLPPYKRFGKYCPNSAALSVTGINLPTSDDVDSKVIARIVHVFKSVLG